MNATTSRKGLQPATGACRWLSEPNRLHQGGVLDINGTTYTVSYDNPCHSAAAQPQRRQRHHHRRHSHRHRH